MERNNLKGNIEFRKLPASRWMDYKELRLEAMKSDTAAFGSSYEDELKHSQEVWEARVQNFLFAMLEGKPIGMAGFLFRSRLKTMHIADIFSVYVKVEFRGMGIGGELMKRTLALIRENNNISKISLSVSSDQLPAVNLYKKLGFVKVGELKNELRIGDRFYNELMMELYL